jgi:myo-inositol-1(or 4)-monophosphatase
MRHDLMSIAESAARAAGEVLREHTGRVTGIRTKSGSADLVSAADVAAGVAVARAILGRLPDARFVIEEAEVHELTGAAHGTLDDTEVWVVDPLDGTTSFVHGYPCYSVSIACLRDGLPVAGAVYNVPADEMVVAALGAGAWRDGDRLACSGAPVIEEALLATGFPYDRGAALDRQLRIFERVFRPAHDIRRDGSAAIDLCHVATGRVDGFWETSLQPWDMAAGVLVVAESGGTVTDFDGQPWSVSTRDVIAANPALHARLLDAIREADAR